MIRMKRCKYMKASGQDVICILKDKVLGDIMGYCDRECERCPGYDSELTILITTERK